MQYSHALRIRLTSERNARRRSYLLIPALLAAAPAWSQAPPDAGALRRQIEQEQQSQLPQRQLAKPAEPGAVNAAPGGMAVQVRAFEFVGNRLLGNDVLQKVVAPWVGKSLDLASLKAVTAAVGQAYRDRGWVVRSFLPHQQIQDGVVRIEVVEARFGKVGIDGAPAGRVPVSQVEAFVQARMRHGEPVNAADLDRGLMLADDLPGVVVAGQLVAGAQPNETDVALKLAAEPRVMGQVAVDNFGARSTDAPRLSADAALASPLGFGDLASGSLIHTRGSDYLRADYTVPIGVNGLRVGADASWFRYRLEQSQFSTLDAHGNSTSLGAHASYPVKLLTGAPLPGWLHYDAAKRSFVAAAVPDRALPLQVLVTVKGVRRVIAITAMPH